MTLVDNLRVIAGAAPDGRLNSDVKEFMVRMKEGGRAASTDELLSMMRGFKDNVALPRRKSRPASSAHGAPFRPRARFARGRAPPFCHRAAPSSPWPCRLHRWAVMSGVLTHLGLTCGVRTLHIHR